MPYEVVNVHIAGQDSTKKKAEIKKDATANGFHSVSAFFMWLYENWKKRQK